MNYYLIDLIGSLFGYSSSQVHLGFYYLNKPDYTKALKWLTKAADNGNPKAHTGLGFINVLDDKIEDALRHYELAINSGDEEAPYLLGHLYFGGENIPKNLNKAFEYFSLSAERGFPDAIHMLAWCYEQGVGVEIDTEKASGLYKKAATLGVREAMEAVSKYESED